MHRIFRVFLYRLSTLPLVLLSLFVGLISSLLVTMLVSCTCATPRVCRVCHALVMMDLRLNRVHRIACSRLYSMRTIIRAESK